jgi:Trk-type K+ transport system membrane component
MCRHLWGSTRNRLLACPFSACLLISVPGLISALQICTPRFADIFNSASAIGFATGYSLHPAFSDRSGSRQHESFGVAKLGSTMAGSFMAAPIIISATKRSCPDAAIHVNNFSNAPAFGGRLMLWPTTNSRNATASHSRDAVASSIVNRAPESLFLRLYFVISTSIGSTSPSNSSRTQIRRFFVSIESSVISPMPRNLVLIANRAVKPRVASFERRRKV